MNKTTKNWQKCPQKQHNCTADDATCARRKQSAKTAVTTETPAKKDRTVPFDAELFRAVTVDALRANGIDTQKYYTTEKAKLYEAFFEKLFAVNAYMNLTAIRSTAEAIVKHLVDSLTVADLIPQDAKVIDIGCGGGFPSIPLAIARPDLEILAFDATAKKVGFVQETSEQLAIANLHTAVGRAEEYAHKSEYRERFDIAVSRAVANMAALCQITLPFVKRGGVVIAMKGPNGLQELNAARGLIWQYGGAQNDVITKCTTLHDLPEPATTPLPCPEIIQDCPNEQQSGTGGDAGCDGGDNERVILQIRKMQATPSSLPGTWAQITKEADKANGRLS